MRFQLIAFRLFCAFVLGALGMSGAVMSQSGPSCSGDGCCSGCSIAANPGPPPQPGVYIKVDCVSAPYNYCDTAYGGSGCTTTTVSCYTVGNGVFVATYTDNTCGTVGGNATGPLTVSTYPGCTPP